MIIKSSRPIFIPPSFLNNGTIIHYGFELLPCSCNKEIYVLFIDEEWDDESYLIETRILDIDEAQNIPGSLLFFVMIKFNEHLVISTLIFGTFNKLPLFSILLK